MTTTTTMMKYLLVALLYSTPCVVTAQRFLRDGFSSTMDSEFQAEMGMDDTSAAIPGMTREMMGMQNVVWELTPPSSLAESLSNKNPQLAKHVDKYLRNKPIALKLTKRRGGTLGLRALGVTASGKKLRAFWRPAQNRGATPTPTSTDFLTISYDDAVRSRLSGVEIEVQLPRFQKHVPSLVYHVSMESGLMNPKAVVTRGDGQVHMYPARDVKKDASKSSSTDACVDVGTGKIGIKMKAGIVDPSWARGRSILRKGRSTGYV